MTLLAHPQLCFVQLYPTPWAPPSSFLHTRTLFSILPFPSVRISSLLSLSQSLSPLTRPYSIRADNLARTKYLSFFLVEGPPLDSFFLYLFARCLYSFFCVLSLLARDTLASSFLLRMFFWMGGLVRAIFMPFCFFLSTLSTLPVIGVWREKDRQCINIPSPCMHTPRSWFDLYYRSPHLI